MKKILIDLWKNKSCRYGILMLGILLFFSFVMPLFFSADPNAQILENTFQKPDFTNIFGTDNLGRNNFLRIIHGSRLSLIISISSSLIAIFIGFFAGAISGISENKIDWFIMRFTDIFMAFPKYFLFIMLLGFSGFTVWKTILVLAFFSWMETAKIIRSEIKLIKSSLFYKSALCQGVPKIKIIYYHLLPNLIGVIISGFSILTATMIILESGISFIGLGVQPPAISLGIILNQARYYPLDNLSLLIFTGLFIILNVTSFNLLGDGIKTIFDKDKYQK